MSTPGASVELPATAKAAAEARTFAHDALCREHGQDAEGAVRLLASELVTHTLRHGTPPIVMSLECEETEIRLEVRDQGHDRSLPDGPYRELSLLLIDKVSRDWGVEETEQGTVFWCTIPTGTLPRRPQRRRRGSRRLTA
jgi:hypothetical protein